MYLKRLNLLPNIFVSTLLEGIEIISRHDRFNSHCFFSAALSASVVHRHLPCQGSGRHPLSRADVAVSWRMVDKLHILKSSGEGENLHLLKLT